MTIAKPARSIVNLLWDFVSNSRGNVTVMVTLAAIPMVATAGLAIDYLRGIRSASEIQSVTDAAALAAASAKNVSGSTSNQLSQRAAIATNYIADSIGKLDDI